MIAEALSYIKNALTDLRLRNLGRIPKAMMMTSSCVICTLCATQSFTINIGGDAGKIAPHHTMGNSSHGSQGSRFAFDQKTHDWGYLLYAEYLSVQNNYISLPPRTRQLPSAFRDLLLHPLPPSQRPYSVSFSFRWLPIPAWLWSLSSRSAQHLSVSSGYRLV